MKTQATKFTAQDMRELSPSGVVHMDKWMGKRFTNTFLIGACIIALSLTYVIDWAVMSV